MNNGVFHLVTASYTTLILGRDPDAESGKALGSVEAYDTHRGGGQWREMPEMRLARKQHGCAVFTNRDRLTVREGRILYRLTHLVGNNLPLTCI